MVLILLIYWGWPCWFFSFRTKVRSEAQTENSQIYSLQCSLIDTNFCMITFKKGKKALRNTWELKVQIVNELGHLMFYYSQKKYLEVENDVKMFCNLKSTKYIHVVRAMISCTKTFFCFF